MKTVLQVAGGVVLGFGVLTVAATAARNLRAALANDALREQLAAYRQFHGYRDDDTI